MRWAWLLLLAFIAPMGASAAAKEPAAQFRIGFLANSEAETGYFRNAMKALGYVEGRNLLIDWRFSKGRLNRLPALAAELVGGTPDCIVAIGVNPTRALKEATNSIPIVMGNADDDPVLRGLVASYARPGGNVTGFTNIGWALAGKRVELLRDMIPGLSRVAVVSQPSSEASVGHVREIEIAAATLGISIDRLELEDIAGVEPALSKAREYGSQAVVVPPVGMMGGNPQRIVQAANSAHLPLVSDRRFAAAGALAGYADDPEDRYHHVADYVDRILKGTDPGVLPVMRPIRFRLVINLKTAKALGLTVPPTLLARADEVIE